MPDAKLAQVDFSAGMYRTGRRDGIPPNGFYDAANGLIDGLGSVYKRGGTAYLASAFGAAGLRFIWDGWTAAGQKTIVATPSKFGTVAAGSVTNINGTGMTNPGRAAVFKGKVYLPGGSTYDGTTLGTCEKAVSFYATAGNRVLAGEKDTIFFSEIKFEPEKVTVEPDKYAANDFHKLPGGVEILGLEGIRDRCAVFSTSGIWLISGLSKALVDGVGNVQQSLDLYNSNFTLWGNAGIAGWEGALVVPGTDGIYLMTLGVSSERHGFARISDPIVETYRSYVRSGYTPGQATVYKGHYLLPIIGAGDVVDLLVCRLDLPGRPWTRLEGNGAKVAALTTRVVSGASRTPELLGALYSSPTSRPITCSYLEPSANVETDHDGSQINFSLTSRAITTGNLVPNLVRRLRARYELTGASAPTVEAQVLAESEQAPVSGAKWGAFKWGGATWGTPAELSFEGLETVGTVDVGGTTSHVWHPRRKRRFVTFRLVSNAKTSKLVVRSLEVFVRLTGRQ